MKIVALLARKGGAGKTTCAIHMGALAQADGQRVLFFDLDPQRSLATWWQSRTAATPPLVETDANRLADLLGEADHEGFDLAVVDTPPAVTFDTARVAALASLVLIPLRPSILDIYAVESTAAVVRTTQARALLVLNACMPPTGAGEAPTTVEARTALKDWRCQSRRPHWRSAWTTPVRSTAGRRSLNSPQPRRQPPKSPAFGTKSTWRFPMTRKPTGLAAAMAKKRPPEPPERETPSGRGAVRTLTLRLPEAVHEQLRELAFHSRRSQHSLAMEGLNCMFERNGKPPIAPV
jgi:chromosome partitioning protein